MTKKYTTFQIFAVKISSSQSIINYLALLKLCLIFYKSKGFSVKLFLYYRQCIG